MYFVMLLVYELCSPCELFNQYIVFYFLAGANFVLLKLETPLEINDNDNNADKSLPAL